MASVPSLLVGWCVVWLGLHVLSVPLAKGCLRLVGRAQAARVLDAVYATLPHDKRAYMRRVLRAQVYYAFAGVMGTYFMVVSGIYAWWPYFTVDYDVSPSPVHQLLFGWHDAMEFVFTGSAVHWALCVYEDGVAWRYLSQGLDDDELAGGAPINPNLVMFRLYTMHHLFTVAAYAFSLYTRQLSALCCFGLMFESPVFLLNVRELACVFDTEFLAHGVDFYLLMGRQWLMHGWNAVFALVVTCRFNAVFVYGWSLVFWWPTLKELPRMTFWMYHILGAFFSGLNLQWACGLLPVFAAQDFDRLAKRERALRDDAERGQSLVAPKGEEEGEEKATKRLGGGGGGVPV